MELMIHEAQCSRPCAVRLAASLPFFRCLGCVSQKEPGSDSATDTLAQGPEALKGGDALFPRHWRGELAEASRGGGPGWGNWWVILASGLGVHFLASWTGVPAP